MHVPMHEQWAVHVHVLRMMCCGWVGGWVVIEWGWWEEGGKTLDRPEGQVCTRCALCACTLCAHVRLQVWTCQACLFAQRPAAPHEGQVCLLVHTRAHMNTHMCTHTCMHAHRNMCVHTTCMCMPAGHSSGGAHIQHCHQRV